MVEKLKLSISILLLIIFTTSCSNKSNNGSSSENIEYVKNNIILNTSEDKRIRINEKCSNKETYMENTTHNNNYNEESFRNEGQDLQAYIESFICDYVEIVKNNNGKKKVEDLLKKIDNINLKKYISYTLKEKTYFTTIIPSMNERCILENTEIKKIDDITFCYKADVIYSDRKDYKNSSYSGAGGIYVVVKKSGEKFYIDDFYWPIQDNPDELYRKEFNPYENYQDFWNNKDEVKLFFGKLRIGN